MRHGHKSKGTTTLRRDRQIGNYHDMSIIPCPQSKYEPIYRAHKMLLNPTLYKVAMFESHGCRTIERTYRNGIEYSHNTPFVSRDLGYTAISSRKRTTEYEFTHRYDADLNFDRWVLKLSHNSKTFASRFVKSTFGALESGEELLSESDKFLLTLEYGSIKFLDSELDDDEKDDVFDIFPKYSVDKSELAKMDESTRSFHARYLA